MLAGMGRTFPSVVVAAFVSVLVASIAGFSVLGAAADKDEEVAIAKSLAAMLSAGIEVISRNQDHINDSAVADKGLDGSRVLAQAQQLYQEMTGSDASAIDPNSRHGRLLRLEMNAIVEVMNAHQKSLNQRGIGFKGFIPATFGRLIIESFGRAATGEAEMKMTAPPELIRNRKARPDPWEAAVIRDRLSSPNWPKGQYYAAVAESRGRPAFRIAVPEYYSESCLACHGKPKGQIDITGYPKEGASEGDLGGVFSITLYR